MLAVRSGINLDVLESRASARPVISGLLLLLTAWLALLWPAAINGQPFLFHDTTAYVRGAAFPAEKFIGLRTLWSETIPTTATMASPSPVATSDLKVKSADAVDDRTVLAGRSVYYGALLFWGFVAGGIWLPVLLQATIVAAAVLCALRLLVPNPIISTGAMLVVLGIVSPLSWFSGYMMPDLFAGLGVLSAALLITHGQQMRRWEMRFWFVLLAFSLVAHTSHLATVALLLSLTLLAKVILQRDWAVIGLAAIAAAIVVAFAADLAFTYAATRVTGAAPVRPPMLTARVMQSETGRAYLRSVCPNAGYSVCAFVDRAPMTANDFLWSPDPAVGVFSQADAPTRRALSSEQMQVFVGALLYDPIASARELLGRWARLLAVTDIPEFNHGPADRSYFTAKLPPSIHHTFASTPSARGTLPVGAFGWLFWTSALCGAALSILLLHRETNRTADLAGFLLLGILLNAAICSALSGVEPRYETRMIWLLPFMASTLSLRRLARSSSAAATQIPRTAVAA